MRLQMPAVLAVATAAAVVAVPHPAFATDAKRVVWSPSDTTAAKTVTADCDPGEVVIGAGGRVRDGAGGVRLDAIRPGRTSVTVRAAVLDDYPEAWSVAAAAICVPEPQAPYAPVVVTSPAGSPTASCPADTFVSGTGFELPGKRVLTGLVPAADGTSVTVWSPRTENTDIPVAYAICTAPQFPLYPARAVAQGPIGPGTATVVTADMSGDFRAWSISGAGAKVTAPPLTEVPTSYSTVFIDALMPDGGATVTAEAVRRRTATARVADPAVDPAGDPAAEGGELVVYGADHDVY